MATAIGNYQPSLVLTETIAAQGIFPAREGDGFAAMTIGMIHTYGFNFGMTGAPIASGQILNISPNTPLFSLLGFNYGGDGQTTFALPNLSGRSAINDGQGPSLTPVLLGEQTGTATTMLTHQQMPPGFGGSSAPVDEDQPELALKYLIATEGVFQGGGLGMLGTVVKFAGNFAPVGYMECAGQLLDIGTHETLFQLIGTTYGGDGQTTFALPDLRGRTVVGTGGSYDLGEVFGQEDVTIGQANLPVAMGGAGLPIDNREPSLALHYIVALQGIFPSQNSVPDFQQQMLGEIIAYAGPANEAPKGWAFCRGQLLPINQNQALFSLFGTQYGGDGRVTFALPDLRGRDVIGQGDGLVPGQVVGEEFTTLIFDNIPDLNSAIQSTADFNADSRADIFWQTDGGSLAIWQMNGFQIGAADFTRLGASAVGLPGPDWHVIDISDVKADGKSDILWRTDAGKLAVWQMDGTHISGADFLRIGATAINAPGLDWHPLGAADFDGDGKGDLLWRTDGGQLAIWELDGNQIKFADFIHAGANTVGVPAADWRIVGTGDFGGDGKADILWETTGGQLAIWQMDGTQIKSASFIKAGANTVGIPGLNWHVSDVADFDGDGKADILWRIGPAENVNSQLIGLPPGGGQVAIWEMNGDQIKFADFTKLGANNVGAPGPDWHLLGADDYNGDGKGDLLWQTDSGALAVWQMDGTHIAAADYTKVGPTNTGVPAPDWHVYQHHYDVI